MNTACNTDKPQLGIANCQCFLEGNPHTSCTYANNCYTVLQVIAEAAGSPSPIALRGKPLTKPLHRPTRLTPHNRVILTKTAHQMRALLFLFFNARQTLNEKKQRPSRQYSRPLSHRIVRMFGSFLFSARLNPIQIYRG